MVSYQIRDADGNYFPDADGDSMWECGSGGQCESVYFGPGRCTPMPTSSPTSVGEWMSSSLHDRALLPQTTRCNLRHFPRFPVPLVQEPTPDYYDSYHDFEYDLDGWSTPPGDFNSFTRTSTGTPSGYTGPDSAHGGNWYVYAEATSSEGTSFGLVQNYSDIVGGVRFFYNMYGSRMGTVKLEASTSASIANPPKGESWDLLWSRSGDMGDSNWYQGNVTVEDPITSAYRKLRFNYTTESGSSYFRGDFALDSIDVDEGFVPTAAPTT